MSIIKELKQQLSASVNVSPNDAKMINNIILDINFIESLSSMQIGIPNIILSYDFLSVGSYIKWSLSVYEIMDIVIEMGFGTDNKGIMSLLNDDDSVNDTTTDIITQLGFIKNKPESNTNVDILDYHFNQLIWILIALNYIESKFNPPHYLTLMRAIENAIFQYNYRYIICGNNNNSNKEDYYIVREFIYHVRDAYKDDYKELINWNTFINYKCWNLVVLPWE